MALQIKAKVDGLKELVQQLKELPQKLQKQTLRKATTEGSQLVLRTAKAKVPVGETGLLKKSLGHKVGISRRTGVVYAVIGPRTGIVRTRTGKKKVTKLGIRFAQAGVKPYMYAHLVEFGHRIAKGGSLSDQYYQTRVKGRFARGALRKRATGVVAGHVPAKPFMRPALDENIQAIKGVYERHIKDALKEFRSK